MRLLRAKETLILNEQTLARHNKLLKDLDTIVKYDAGRRSELIEARARQLQVANIIAQQRRTMDLALTPSVPLYLAPADCQRFGRSV